MFDDWIDVFQSGVKCETFEIPRVNLGERARETGIHLKCSNIHKVGLDTWANLFAKLGEDLEAAIIHIGPQIDWYFLGNQAEEVADGGRGIAHEADCCMLRGECSVVSVFTCVPVYLLVEGGEIFDAEHGFGADGDFIDRCYLGRGEAYGRYEGVKVDDLSVDVGEFPVSSKMNVTGIGDEIEFTEDVFGGE